jgi:hypothetical protein
MSRCARRSDDTDARKATVRRFGRSDRSAQQLAQQVYDQDRMQRGEAACAAPAEAIMLAPAGSPGCLRWTPRDILYIHPARGWWKPRRSSATRRG